MQKLTYWKTFWKTNSDRILFVISIIVSLYILGGGYLNIFSQLSSPISEYLGIGGLKKIIGIGLFTYLIIYMIIWFGHGSNMIADPSKYRWFWLAICVYATCFIGIFFIATSFVPTKYKFTEEVHYQSDNGSDEKVGWMVCTTMGDRIRPTQGDQIGCMLFWLSNQGDPFPELVKIYKQNNGQFNYLGNSSTNEGRFYFTLPNEATFIGEFNFSIQGKVIGGARRKETLLSESDANQIKMEIDNRIWTILAIALPVSMFSIFSGIQSLRNLWNGKD